MAPVGAQSNASPTDTSPSAQAASQTAVVVCASTNDGHTHCPANTATTTGSTAATFAPTCRSWTSIARRWAASSVSTSVAEGHHRFGGDLVLFLEERSHHHAILKW